MTALSAFVGREEEQARLTELLAEHRLVTVTGPGGVGKSRLASEACQAVAERFAGGVRRAELAPLSRSADVGVAVAGQLGLPTPEALAVSIGDRPSLVVLDNCEHVLSGAADLAALLLDQTPALRLLATSRSPLGVDGEHVLVLETLDLPVSDEPDDVLASPVAQLYLDRARAAGARWEPTPELVAALAELCRRLDGMPLAVELAAARARTLSAAELVEHLDRRLDLLKHRGQAVDPRHESLRAAIETSYVLLDDDEQALFRRLSVFGGPFDADLAHDVCAGPDADRLDTLDRLAGLVDRSLVVAERRGGATRYRLLDSLRAYARERLADERAEASTEEAFVDRMAAEALNVVADALESFTADVLARVDGHFRNLIAALDRCVRHDTTPDRAYVLLVPLWGAIAQARFHEVAAVGRRVLARWPDTDGPGRWEATATVAMAHLATGDLGAAEEVAARCVGSTGATPLARLMSHRVLGFARRAVGDLAGARSHFRSALEAGAPSPAFERDLVVSAASVDGAAGSAEAALATLAEVAASSAAVDDRVNEVRAHVVTAELLLLTDRPREAATAIERVAERGAGAGYPWAVGTAVRLGAVVTALEDGWPASLPRWRDALDHFMRTGDLREASITVHDAAGAAARAGHADVAADLLAVASGNDGVTIQPDLFTAELAGLDPAGTLPPPSPHAALRRARALLDGDEEAPVPESAPPAPAPAAAPGRAALVRRGDGWDATFRGRTTQLRHLKGLGDLALLVSRPDQDVHCLELMGAADVGSDTGAALDERARRAYQARIRDLQEEVDDASAANDPMRAARAEAELDALVQQLSEAFGLSGRSRSTGSSHERARVAVTWRIRAAIRHVTTVHEELGRHLDHAVRTGTWCSYRPEDPVHWEVATG